MLKASPQDIADIVREAIISTFDAVIAGAAKCPAEMTANEFGEGLSKLQPGLVGQLTHALEQKAAELADAT